MSSDPNLITRIEKLEKIISEIPTGGMLSSSDFLELHITDDSYETYLENHKNGSWDEPCMKKEVEMKIGDLTFPARKACFLIMPFHKLNVTPFSYDLAIGEQYYSLKQEGKRAKTLDVEPYWMEQGETIIVLTEEYVALPPDYSATVWPRFSPVREGVFQSMVKIDPTWRGRLAVALTNVSPAKYPIRRGMLFATLILYELTRRSKYSLCPIDKVETIHKTLPRSLSEKYTLTDINRELNKQNILELCEAKRLASGALELIIHRRMRKEKDFEKLKQIFSEPDWEKAVNEIIEEVIQRPEIGMEAYNLEHLDRILEGRFEGIRETRTNIENLKEELSHKLKQDNYDKLIEVGIEYGGPFRYLSAIPRLTLDRIEKDIIPQIQAQVSADLFPKLITLTLSVLGMLSLVSAIIALILQRFPRESPLGDMNWPGTIAWVAVVIGALTLITFICLLSFGFVSKFLPKIEELISKTKTIMRDVQSHSEEINKLRGKSSSNECLLNLIERVDNLEKDFSKLMGLDK